MIDAPPVAMTIAGSDCSAGAGMQADLKTFQHFQVHGLTVATCVVAETANAVRAIHAVPPEVLHAQLDQLLEEFPVNAMKTGMLFSAAHVLAVADALDAYPGIPLVVDPVMVASSGASLLEPAAIAAYVEELLPAATLITPNLPEAEVLLGTQYRGVMAEDARLLAEKFNTAVLLKGGHLNSASCTDLLVTGDDIHEYTAPRIALPGSHGTGCTFSAAITARLAHGDDLPTAVATAKAYLTDTLARSYQYHSPNGTSVHALNQGTK